MSEKVVLGVDVGGTNVKAGLVKQDGTIVVARSWPTASEKGFPHFKHMLHQHMVEMAQDGGCSVIDIVAIGVGLPGFINMKEGILHQAVNLKWSLNVPVVKSLHDTFNIPVFMDNDGNLAALGEVWIGAGNGSKSAFCVTIGTGVGGGIVIDGCVYRGVSTMAGEIGHLPMKPNGELCNCGKRGCLETLASATALTRMAKRVGLQSLKGVGVGITAEDVFQYAKAGNTTAVTIVEQMASWLSLGLVYAANLLNPDVIVIGGGVVQAGDTLFQPLVQFFNDFTLARVASSCRLVPAKLGTRAGMLGAARMAWQSR